MNHRTLRVENTGQTAHKSPLHSFTLAALSTSPTGKNVPPFSWTVMRHRQTWKMKSRKNGWLSLAAIVAQASYSYFCPQAQPFTLSIKALTSLCSGQGQPHDQIAGVATWGTFKGRGHLLIPGMNLPESFWCGHRRHFEPWVFLELWKETPHKCCK